METLATQEYLEDNYRWAGEFQRKSESQTVKEYILRKGIQWRNGKQQHSLINSGEQTLCKLHGYTLHVTCR